MEERKEESKQANEMKRACKSDYLIIHLFISEKPPKQNPGQHNIQ